jgi:hypothetical protein
MNNQGRHNNRIQPTRFASLRARLMLAVGLCVLKANIVAC